MRRSGRRAAERRGVEGVAALGGGGAQAWLDAVTHAPLLPGRILPSEYPGQQALPAVRNDRRRVEVLRDAGRQLPVSP